MGIRVALNHTTTYSYDRPVILSPHVLRLRPAPHARTPVHSYSLKVEPDSYFLNWQQDPYSNHLARLVFRKPTNEMRVTVDLIAEMTPINPFDFFLEESAQKYPFVYEPLLAKELAPYLETLPAGPLLQKFVEDNRREGATTNDYIVEVNRSVAMRVKYLIRMEPGIQTPEETLTLASGSCRDSAWLLVQACRHLGIAARFCSGYLIQLVADEKPLGDGPAGPTVDFTDLHAWTEVYLPGAGWIGLDPTSGLLTAEGHIPLACTADPQTAAAVSGGFSWTPRGDVEDDKVEQSFAVSMTVTRIAESPRVTKPYTEEQWNTIDKLGHNIDGDLLSGDVRLTMGGEPTFVSIDNRDADEWNTTALGSHKRASAIALLYRLRDRFSNGAFLHFGQGKWYPGESLPRWAFGCFWRADGVPIWNDQALVADEVKPSGATAETAALFVAELARALDVQPEHAVAGYEDAWYYMWREGRLPTNVNPLDNKLESPEERVTLAKIFDQSLCAIVGYALPLRKSDGGWQSGRWLFRREQMFLYPGDSPMGFRLPLDSLLWEPMEKRQTIQEVDPFAPRTPLPQRVVPQPRASEVLSPPAATFKDDTPPTTFHDDASPPTVASDAPLWMQNRGAEPSPSPETVAPPTPIIQVVREKYIDDSLVRTAICIEARAGTLYVFLPPSQCLEDFLELIAAIEATAAKLAVPVMVEGYKPPSDSRLSHFSVTPDPGVIEVNLHPVTKWDEIVHNTTHLYEEARLSRLTAEKFMLDGRHTGTGGGNHVVVGGPTPGDSPLLRRPDLLRSLLGFWHNHPALSYLFSGVFIGPTSQHPRVDEARHDALYELDIAFQQVVRDGREAPAWLVDRLFRHLLTDATGNTHRTEFCIDKLFSPDSAEGRRGLLELRSFEMPPHSRMSCVQQLLLRGMISWFWQTPYTQPLVRWGTTLHDRFMLPHFVEADLRDALGELRRGGYNFDPAWFAPHMSFRFPIHGEIARENLHLEIRHALEPWHVLGEEGGPGGTARYVDSSVERLQVKVRGSVDGRYVITCNNRRVPMHPTGTAGEFVAGVRYRAWKPPSCLHPHIPVHAPLIFDIFDTWNGRSIGGCQYHVSHPGGRSDERFPVNSLEAEGRRLARFFAFGHTAGTHALPPAEPLKEFPFTLDLRQTAPRW